jgi:hypothetical protein
MNLFISKYKKFARLKAARKNLPKAQRAFFATLLVAVAMQYQAQIVANVAADPGLSAQASANADYANY